MDKHPIPRQVTTFEFKLIGFFTVRQFVYLVIFSLLAVLTYFSIPVPYLNLVSGAVVFGLGVVFSLSKYNERSLDVWLINLVRSIIAPSQYYYKKAGKVPEYFNPIPTLDPKIKNSHIDAQKKLASYLSKTNVDRTDKHKQQVVTLINTVSADQPTETSALTVSPPAPNTIATDSPPPKKTPTNQPFLSGVVRNHQALPLPNIMIYVRDENNKIIRILKSNSKGVFASFHPLANNTYSLETKDPNSRYFFDTMKVVVDGRTSQPITIQSKELL